MATKPSAPGGKTSRGKTAGARSASDKAASDRAGAGRKRPKPPDGPKLLDFYRQMVLIRRFEERAGQMYGMGLIGGFCHLYIGQEAVVVGIQGAQEPADTVITTYRDHGHMLACGMEASGVMAELMGRRTGYSKGKGGSMHMFSRERKFYGGHGIVGANVPLGTGMAFAHRYRGDGGVCVTYFGDGALNQGQVAEAFNMAALWRLPVLYVIENNRYGMGTAVERATATTELYRRGEAFGIAGARVDGMDVRAVHEAARQALAHVRGGQGPFVLEAMTYRYRGHSMSDPARYRTRDEVQAMRTGHDPIETLKAWLLKNRLADADTLGAIDRQIRADVAAAAEFAQNSPEPGPEALLTDVLVAA